MSAELLDLVKIAYLDADEALKAQRTYFDSLRTRTLSVAGANVAVSAFLAPRFAESSGTIEFYRNGLLTPDGIAVGLMLLALVLQFSAIVPRAGWKFSFDLKEFSRDFLSESSETTVEERYFQASQVKQAFFRENDILLARPRSFLVASLILVYGQVVFWVL